MTTTPHRARTGAVSRLGSRALTSFGALIVLVILWQIATTLWPSMFFPTPLRIVENFITLFLSGPASSAYLTDLVTRDIAQSLWRLILGFLLGSAMGIALGTAIGRSMLLRQFSDPIVEFLRSIPATATLPLFVILLGGEDSMRVAFVAYAVLWFVLINTASGVNSIHATLIDMGRIFRQPGHRMWLRIILPAALPKIWAGLKIGLTVALLATVVSEFMFATNGFGYQLLLSQARFSMIDIWTWMLFLALLGFLLNTIMDAIEARVLAWDRMARAKP